MTTTHPATPMAHTPAELARLVALLTGAGARTVAVAHGRQPGSVAAARAFEEAWADAGNTVVAVVDYPERAASWLRAARRLTEADPDAYVAADTPSGFARLARRLAEQSHWEARKTYGFASLASQELLDLAGPSLLDGMTGVSAAGDSWWMMYDLLVHHRDGHLSLT